MTRAIAGRRRALAIYDGAGWPVDGRRAPLMLEDLAEHEHHALIAGPPRAPIVWIIKLDDDAAFAALPPGLADAVAELAATAGGVLLIARRQAGLAAVRAGLLANTLAFRKRTAPAAVAA